MHKANNINIITGIIIIVTSIIITVSVAMMSIVLIIIPILNYNTSFILHYYRYRHDHRYLFHTAFYPIFLFPDRISPPSLLFKATFRTPFQCRVYITECISGRLCARSFAFARLECARYKQGDSLGADRAPDSSTKKVCGPSSSRNGARIESRVAVVASGRTRAAQRCSHGADKPVRTGRISPIGRLAPC